MDIYFIKICLLSNLNFLRILAVWWILFVTQSNYFEVVNVFNPKQNTKKKTLTIKNC